MQANGNNGNNGTNNGGGDSPESVSLYNSDEIASGYNSGEQVGNGYLLKIV
jgi:hypothetical protein